MRRRFTFARAFYPIGRVARRSDFDRVCRSPSRPGIASDHSWGVCARLSPSRKSRQATAVRRAQSSSSSRGLGQRARRLSAVVHLAIHPGRHGRESRWFNDLERVSATLEMMERFVIELSEINVTDFLPKVKAPTLVTHCKGDVRVPFALGQEIAAGIPGAKFVPLDSRNHVFLADEPATRVF